MDIRTEDVDGMRRRPVNGVDEGSMPSSTRATWSRECRHVRWRGISR